MQKKNIQTQLLQFFMPMLYDGVVDITIICVVLIIKSKSLSEMKEKLLYFVLFLFVAIPLFAQKENVSATFTIKGQVIDFLTNESVPYVTLRIALASAPKNPVKLLACDEDGKFTATMNKPGKYVML